MYSQTITKCEAVTLGEERRLDDDLLVQDASISQSESDNKDLLHVFQEDRNTIELAGNPVQVLQGLAGDPEGVPLAIDLKVEANVTADDSDSNRLGHGISPERLKQDATKADDRSASIHAAKVYLSQSRYFTGRHRAFSFVLLRWSANARLRAMSLTPHIPAQRSLF